MKTHLRALIILMLAITIPTSCKKNHYRVNTSSVKVNIEIKRLERDLFSLNPEQVIPMVPSIKKKYGGFLQLFSLVINTGDINESSFGDLLLRFCSDKQNNEVYELTMKKFPDIFTCITGFNNSIITGDSSLGIGLDRYLGADCTFYPRLNIFKYLAARMTPENIIPDCIYGWGASEWDFSALRYPADNVLAEIIHNGKLKYFEKCMLPETSDDLIFGFTPEQMKFCRNNESQMWEYLVENNLLFSTDQLNIRKLTGEAPFTGFFTKESPGRAAVWIGFRIVESYMMKNPGAKIGEMISDTDVQNILEKAKYSPQ